MPDSDRAIASSRAPVRARCPLCSAPLAPEDQECPACAAPRPVPGWPRIAELVVHPGGRAPEVVRAAPPVRTPPEPEVRTVYLQPVAREAESHTGRLAITFLGSFALTSAVVLGTWTGLTLSRPPPPAPVVIPQVQWVEIERPVPVPVPAPIPEPPAPVAQVAPRPAPLPSVPIEAPPVVVEVPPPAPPVVPPPPPVRTVPAAAAALAGAYRGKAGGRPLSLHLRFEPDGVLAATVERTEGPSTVTVRASGEYEIIGEDVTILLLERGVALPRVYSGTVSHGAVEGRVNEAGRNIGRFSVQR